MLLAIDIGNTNVTTGVFSGDNGPERHWRLATDRQKSGDEYGIILSALLSKTGLNGKIDGAVISSVVPSLNDAFREAVSGYIGVKPVIAGEDVAIPVETLVDNPQEIGADRLINALAAYRAHKTSLIIADFGTAITFDYVTGDGKFAGGAIAPGIGVSADVLSKRTEKLPVIDIAKPAKLIGRNTVEAMRAGIWFGFAALTDGIIEQMKKEAASGPKVVATGGMAGLIARECKRIDMTDEFLTLKGLNILFTDMNRAGRVR